ncbi:MAG: formylglycine-generating enzyme family protein [Aureliella sp.]
MFRIIVLAVLACGYCPALAVAEQVASKDESQATPRIGVVVERPQAGRFVKVPDGFMVPYDQKLPGSKLVIRMQPIPGGAFVLPSKVAGGSERTVEIQPMWMAQYEVSWKQYSEFMSLYRGIKKIARTKSDIGVDSVDAVSAPTEIYEPSLHMPFAESPLQPATGMTQYGARQFTKWLSLRSKLQYRLPGEDEWTYACIGGESSALAKPIERAVLERMACFDNLPNGAAIAGSFAANAFGLYDMLGNSAEWVITQRGHAITANWPPVRKQLLDAEEGFGQLACGGSWMDFPSECQPLSRVVSSGEWSHGDPNVPLSPYWHANTEYSATIGFRICRQLKAIPREEMQQYWDAVSEQVRYDDDIRVAGGRAARAVITDEIEEAARLNPVTSHRFWDKKK